MKKFAIMLSLAAFAIMASAGSANASIFTVWADTDSDGFKDLYLGDINGYEGTLTGNNNYNYFSASGHPVNGPNPHRNRLKFFVYERTTNNRNFLNIIAGRDNGGTQHRFALDILTYGSTLNPNKVRGDENGEFNETSNDLFQGDWRFRNNSDGGVIGRLKGPWEARITPIRSTLNRHVVASNGGPNIRLDNLGYDHYFISTAPVPEPATIALLGSGLFGLVGFRRKRS